MPTTAPVLAPADLPRLDVQSSSSAPLDFDPNALAVHTQDLRRIYRVGTREVHALRGISMDVESGRFVALKGRSGSGKTTLINCVGGLDQPTAGTVHIFGRNIAELNDRQRTAWRARHLGFIFQSFGLLPTLSAYENVELMLRLAGAHRRQRHDRTIYCLTLVGLSRWIQHRPYEMSGGQQQRVAIARALANAPQLILADEPTGELDSSTAREILSIFRRIVDEEHVSILMTSHDPLVDDYVDTIFRLQDGQIVES
jgi:putative ABC transport system ATP-binding protein